jgi:hypothetical protein
MPDRCDGSGDRRLPQHLGATSEVVVRCARDVLADLVKSRRVSVGSILRPLPATREAEAPRRASGDFADRVGIGEPVETAQVDGIVLDCPAGSR